MLTLELFTNFMDKVWRGCIVLLIVLWALIVTAPAQSITKGTGVGQAASPASTSVTSVSPFSAVAGAVLLCGSTYDDNATNTQIATITISGSPTYSIPWQQIPANGRIYNSNIVGKELWYAVTSSGFTAQSITMTLTQSQKFGFACQSYSGVNQSAPIAGSNQSLTTSTVIVTNTGKDNSKYVGYFGCGDNSPRTFTAGTAYDDDACFNCANEPTTWAHGVLETGLTPVSPAADTTIDMVLISSCTNPSMIGVELAVAVPAGPVLTRRKALSF